MTTTGLFSVISLAFIVSLCLVHYSSATGSHTSSSWASMIPRSRYSFVNTICEGRTKTIRCVSAGHVILIEDAFYGRRDGSTCPSSTMRTRRCKSSKALPIVWARCNGRRSCTITASNTRFQGDPCRGTYKYVQLQFRCGNPGTDTVGTCFANSWGSWLDIDNPSGTGDYELLSTHRSRSRSACSSPTGMQIQMKTGGSYNRAGNAMRNSLSYGMTCLNSEQSLMTSRTCKDYKVRYCCRGGASGIPCRRPTIPSGVNAWPSSKSIFNTNEYIRFTCPSGKTLSGGVSRTTCQANGAWLPSRVPTCVTSSSGCRGLARLSHGTITPRRTSWPVGSMATFTCDSGYSLVGRSPIRCMSNGQWSGSAPTCAVVSRDCGGEIVGQTSGRIQSPNYPNNYPNHKDCTWEITVNAGQTIEITIEKFALEANRRCRYDYLEIFNGTSRNTRILKLCGYFTRRTYRSTGRSATLRFHSDSSVNKKGFDIRWRAVGAGCPVPTAPSYGTVSPTRSQHNPGDYVTYSCRTGYRLVGQARVRCGSSGSWSSSAPTCERRGPVTPTFKSCYAVGDPHYCTFDGKRFDYQGVCSYVLVKASSVPHGSNLRPFVVEVDNEHRGGNTRVSWLRKVIVRVGGTVIELLKGKVVQVDSETVNLPFSHSSSGVNIKFSGRFVVLTTSFQMKIIYDGKSYLTVRMPSTYSGIVEGLCGNYNGNPDDDFTRRGTRIILTDPTQFGNQFQTSSKPGCTRALPPRDETCPASRKSVFRRQCSIITEENGCFASCHSLSDPAPFLRDCVFDACVYNDELAALENNVGSYAQICQALGARICPEWRNTTNTPLSCGPNSHYNPCGSSCPRTCSQPRTVSCDRRCVEQCECDSGYVLSGDTCVRTSECGCSQNGKYYKNGDVTYTSGCGRKCTCQRGRMTCVRARCGSNKRCGRDVFGRVACVPTGYGLCKAWGDPHYMTFDGSGWFDFMGTCSYTMARTNTLSTNDQRWFHVVATNEHRGSNTRVSFIKHITVTLFGGTVAVRLEKNRVVKVNGNVVASYHSPQFSIQISGRSTLLSTQHGLKVWFNGNGVRVKVPSTYKGQVHGVCGDYNGIKSDDLKTSSGVVTSDFNEFAQSYQIGNCSDRIPEPFTCSNSERQRWSAEEFCGSLTSRTGVFRPCHHTIDANTFFQKCVFDVCASNGDTTVLEQALEIYSEVCQAHDVELCDWRSRTNTRALRCPVYSHYEGCASACTDTCEEPYASSNCHIHGKVEACVCDVGYVRDGDNCIRKSECGCRVGNYYIRRGQRLAIPREYKVCTCLGQNRVRCTCSTGYTGTPCRDINECLSNPCDENASCTNTRGSFRCECDAGYNGNGFDCSASARCAPEAILHGSYYTRSSNPRSVGSSIRYSCFRGYEIIGQAVLTCEEGGDWSHDFPTCADVDECGGTEQRCNEHATCVNLPGRYTCTCNEGYTGSGTTCTANKCPVIIPPRHGTVNPHTTGRHIVTTVLQFECNTGYTLSGASSIECLSNGRWSDEVPTCSDVNECDTNPCHPNANCRNTPGSYRCTCGSSYTGDGHTCTGITCTKQRIPRHATALPSDVDEFSVGGRVTYRCDDGYELVGEVEVICESSGSWSSSPPRCVDINECTVNAGCHPEATCTNTAGSFYCSCNEEYTGDGINCTLISCQELVAPANGAMIPAVATQNVVGSVVRFSCNTGYMVEGSESTVCLSNGQWSADPPTCKDVDECSDNNPCHEHANCHNSVGNVQCTCKQGYQGDGTFCLQITCPFPGTIPNGNITLGQRDEYLPGNELVYSCNNGYTLTTRHNRLICEATGDWSHTLPTCADVDECSESLNPCHADADCDNFDGGYTCNCHEGFSGDGITCQEIVCGSLDTPENGQLSLIRNTYSVGTVVTLTCDEGYEANGASSTVCLSGGQWSDSTLTCSDKNECETGSSRCDSHATCINTDGSYNCSCQDGYYGDGIFCELITCFDPVVSEFGSSFPSSAQWLLNSAITFRCNAGYTLVGASSAVCTGRGVWSNDPPACEDINECQDAVLNTCDLNAECDNTEGSFTCTCNAQYSGDGRNCQQILCPALSSSIENGIRSPSEQLDWIVDSRVNYRCNTGYMLSGNRQLTCTGSGSWNVDEPTCVDMDECSMGAPCHASATCTNTVGSFSCECEAGYTGNGEQCTVESCSPPMGSDLMTFDPSNLPNYPINTIVTYSCVTGYEIEGNNPLSCDEGGLWSDDEPTCVDIDECDPTSEPVCDENASCSNSVGSYMCMCNDGYIGDGQSCNQITCPHLDDPANGSLEPPLTENPSVFGDTVNVECEPGYSSSGNTERECQRSGQWSGVPFICNDINECVEGTDNCDINARCSNNEGSYTCTCNNGYRQVGEDCELIVCPTPPVPDNALLVSSSRSQWLLNSVARYRCSTGYTMIGGPTSTCQESGDWSEQPTCVDINECDLSLVRRPCDPSALCENTEGSYTCQCNEGYRGNGVVCELIICSTPSQPANGNLISDTPAPYLLASSVEYTCNTGFSLHGSASATCMETGVWSTPEPTCRDINECLDPSISRCDDNASCTNRFGSYTCTCNNAYSGDGFSCTRTECGQVTAPINGAIDSQSQESWYAGQSVQYSCNSGYAMFGSEMAVCQANGEWSSDEPTCSDINECNNLFGSPCHRNAECTNTEGSYECTCEENYTGSGTNCRPILCSRPDQVVNGGYTLTTSTTIRVGTRVVYHCDNGYSAVGERVAQCNSEGEWSSIPPTCEDINECQDDIDNCDEFASCTNTEGSFTCECNVGFTGSGESCTVIECPHPRRPFNGFIFPVVAPQDKWVSNDYVIYSCRDGFSLSGSENATCQPDGAWTNGNRPPTCSDINECEEQPCDPNASCRNQIGSYTCTCNEGYSGSGSTCTEILCPALNNPASGSVTITSRNVQGVANYECNTGYRLDGPQVITCFSNGRWSSEPPACVDENECITGARCDIHATCSNTIGSYTCQCDQDYTGTGEVCTKITCAELPSLDNGSLQPELQRRYDVNSDVRYRCDTGYQLTGSQIIQCTSDGLWSEQPPTCEDVDECSSRIRPCDSNARCENSVGSFTCTCNSGYTGTGFVCEELRCRDPLTINHGSFTSQATYAVGSRVQFTCDHGYEMQGDQVMVCNADGEWNTPEPTCTDINECSATGSGPCDTNALCENTMSSFTCTCNDKYTGDGFSCTQITCTPKSTTGVVIFVQPQSVYLVDQVATYACPSGYTMVGSRQLTCLETGFFSDNPPTCTDVNECRESPCDENAACTNIRGTFSCTCNTGYSGDGTTCQRISCSDPVSPSNGLISNPRPTYYYGNTVFFTCHLGYERIGSRSILCTVDGIWSEPEPTCEDKNECDPTLPSPCHSQATCSNTQGGYTCSCNDGYSGDGHLCTEITCRALTPILNGQFTPRLPPYRLNDVVTHTCNDGYQIQGSSTITCQSNGAWLPARPRCVDINECQDPTTCDENARCTNIRGGFECSCNEGYRGNGLTCELITCDDLVAPTHGSLSSPNSSPYVISNVVTFSCDNGYSLSHTTSLTCLPSGSWSVRVPRCIDVNECLRPNNFPCSRNASCTNTDGSFSCSCNDRYTGDGIDCTLIDCPAPRAPRNGKISPTSRTKWLVDQSVRYMCEEGYELVGTEFATCMRDRRWSSPPPTCEDENECLATVSPCSPDATCVNVPGSYECNCNEGFSGDGNFCSRVKCIRPVRIDHGTYRLSTTSNIYVGTNVVYQCNPGYRMSGSASATCLGNALWSEVPPSCTDINECRQNSDSCHDDAECRNNIGSYTCTCREGFNGDGFNCEPNECFIPNTPAYASIVSQTRTRYIATNTITYECNGGYGMVGEDTITCQSDGSWSADPPTCEDNDECTQNTPCDPNASCDNTPGSYTCSCNERYTGDGETCTEIQCGSLSNPTSGTVTIPSQTVGGTATYSCNTGYVIHGATTRTCLSSGSWSKSPPQCIDENECITGAQCDIHATCSNTIGSYTCQCHQGYTGTGEVCTKITCAELSSLDNGSLQPELQRRYDVNSFVRYRCDTGYQLTGSQIIQCTSDGLWSEQPPTCEDINECTPRLNECDSNASCENSVGSFTCTCNSGYTGTGIFCEEIKCQKPAEILKGNLDRHLLEYSINETVTYTCLSGYQIDGEESLVCQSNGQWSHPEPLCVDIDECNDDIITNPCDASATCENIQGSFICTCNSGYTGDGLSCEEITCSTPSSQFAELLSPQESYRVGEVAEYICGVGFTLMGSASITCTDNGHFSDLPPTCTDVNECSSSPCDVNAACTNIRGDFTCTCNSGYQGNGDTCTRITCRDLNAPDNGFISNRRDEYVSGNTAVFRCNNGYALSSRTPLRCMESGDWSDVEPTCEDKNECDPTLPSPCHSQATCSNTQGSYTCSCNDGYSGDGSFCSQITCGILLPIAHGSFTPRRTSPYPILTEVTFSCNSGFQLVSDAVIVCQADGTWSDERPQCEDINECDDPTKCDENAVCTNTRGSYQCTCNSGFRKVGDTCELITCVELSAPVRGSVTFDEDTPYPLGTTATYSCNTGYTVIGISSLTCLGTGRWSSTPPACEDTNECNTVFPCSSNANCENTDGSYTCTCKDGYSGDGISCTKIQCNRPSHPDQGRIVGSRIFLKYDIGSTVTFQCNSGYDLVGDATITCEDDGSWSSDEPTCTDTDECSANISPCDENAECTNVAGGFFCTCNHGYRGPGNKAAQRTCELITCDDRPAPSRGSVTSESSSPFLLGNTVSYSCDRGFTLRGINSATCQENGFWSSNTPVCTDINECGRNPCGDNAICNNRDGGFECVCIDGYSGDGQICTLIQCRDPEQIVNGRIVSTFAGSNGYIRNSVVRYACNTGFVMDGDNELTCLETGVWSSDFPTCQDVDECSSRIRPCDSNARCENSVGSFTCTCNSGYTGTGFVCEEITCRNLLSSRHGSFSLSLNGNVIGSVATFTCNPGYTISGDATLTCGDDGAWSGSEPSCVDVNECTEGDSPCDENAECVNFIGDYRCTCNTGYEGNGIQCSKISCGEPIVPSHASIVDPKSGYVYEDVVEYQCDDGYNIQGSSTITCLATGRYSDFPPVCTDVDECRDNPCHADAACSNRGGTFVCTCNTGYSGDGITSCTRITCPSLSAPSNGFISNTRDEYVVNYVAIFRCNNGYELNSQTPLTCQSTGSWSHEEPTCTDKNECDPTLPSPCHSQATCSNTVGSFTCSCNDGYSGDGSFCSPVRCSQPNIPSNGRITDRFIFTHYDINSSVTFICRTGYQIVGVETITCESSGQWSDQEPTCQDINECSAPDLNQCDNNAECTNSEGGHTCACNHGYHGNGRQCTLIICPDRQAPSHGTLSTDSTRPFTLGNTVSYTCDSGYQLSGSDSAECQQNGVWSAREPTCRDINECLSSPCNENAVCGNLPGSFECTCRVGYSEDGQQCSAIQCRTPNQIPNAQIIFTFKTSDDYTVGSFVRYRCLTGYNSVGSNQVTCQQSGQWTSFPTCEDINECTAQESPCDPNAGCVNTPGSYECNCNAGYTGSGSFCQEIKCRNIRRPLSGSYQSTESSNIIGNVVTFECIDGYTLVGQASITCLDTALWSDSEPACRDDNECIDGTNSCDTNARCDNIPGSYRCTCHTGYTGNGRQCSRSSCSIPPTTGATISSGEKSVYLVGSVIVYSCGTGFTMNGPSSITCQANGQWTSLPPACSDINECADIFNQPCDPHATCTNTHGGFQCTCNTGYSGSGSFCSQVSCEELPALTNGRHQSSKAARYSVGDVVTYSCNTGYLISGSDTLTCSSDGVWDNIAPICIDDDECLNDQPCSVNADCNNNVGSFTCVCQSGYQGNGINCQEIRCARPTWPLHGSFAPEDPSYGVGDTIAFECENGYGLDRDATIECTNTGEWSGPYPRCTNIDECVIGNDCGPDATCTDTIGSYQCACNIGYYGDGRTCRRSVCIPPNNVTGASYTQIKDEYDSGNRVTYTCGTGYRTHGSSVLTCQANGLWSSAEPTCIDDDECTPHGRICSRQATCLNSPGSYTCTCNTGYTGNGIFCTGIVCQVPPVIRNGRYAPRTLDVWGLGVEVRYQCNSGYTLRGASRISCINNGQWSSNPPECEDTNECADPFNQPCHQHATCTNTIGGYNCACNAGYSGDGSFCERPACGLPPSILHATYAPSNRQRFAANSVVTYTCSSGYRISGGGTVTCQQDGSWLPAQLPTCEDINECNEGHDCHSHATCTNIPGNYRCTCNTGYSGSGQHCQEVTCNPPVNPNQGFYIPRSAPRWYAGISIQFQCNRGYRVVGESSATCQNNGHWSLQTPPCTDVNECHNDPRPCSQHAQCVNNEGSYRCTCSLGYFGDGVNCMQRTCSEPPVPHQGTFARDGRVEWVVNDIVVYSCNTGYALLGQRQAQCTDSGQWSPVPPTCRDVNECLNSNPCHQTATCVNNEGSYTCRCPHGHQEEGESCVAITCSVPTPPARGTVSPANQFLYRFSDVITYRCIPGYEIVGNAQANCMDNGEWSHPVPRCDDKNECQQANPPCHQHADCVNEVGSYTCTCRDGFVGNGITCTVPVCRPVTRPTHGTFSTSDPVWRVGTEVTFQCSNGYSLVGSATITCLTGAVWSHRIPACHDVDECIDPNIECNEQASCSNTNGGYNCVCNRGYSGDGQVCTLVTCEEPLSTSHGSFSPLVVQGPRQYNHAVTYHCYDGFILEGASTAVCQQNGQWSNPPPTCRRDIPDVRWCTASGDPHYDTFDGQHYEFQGQCLYDFIKSTNVAHAAGHPQLTVQTENERRFGLTHVTWLKKAIIRLPNIVIELRKALVVLINGIQTTLSYDDPASGVSVRISGRYVTITTSFGMRLRYDGNHYLTIGLPASYAGAVEGLCGNYNGDPTDDMIDRSTGQVASSSVAFGNSYQINSADECAAASATTSACTAAQRADYEAQCSIITNLNGCFSECHSIVPPETSFQNCVFDLCAFNGEKASLVENVAAYATDCQANGITPCIWRNVIGAPLNCTANSQYKLCTSACPNTCVDATASSSCSDVCTEGCECDDGFIMSGTFCVPFSQCGCVDNGRYYMNDESFYTANCERHCDCLNGQLLCSDAGCRTGEKCGADDDGRLRCLQPTSSCNEVPIGKNIRLPPSCAVTYFDVGACPSVVCPGTNFFETQCCGVVERRMVQVDCGNGETISVSKVTRCGCSTCIKQTITVSGKVYGLNADGTEMPLSHGTVIRNNRSAATTDVNGKFSLNVDSDVDRLVLTFVDRFRRLMTTTKILEFKRLGGAIFHNIRVPLKESVHNFISTDRGDFHPTSHGRTSVINIMVEPNSYFQKSGSSYNGRVRSSITYIDPRDVSSYLEAPSDLRTEDGRVMRSYGMFELDFRNFQNYELDVRNIRISLQASEVGILSEQRQMRMWSLNPVNGLWYDEGEMALISSAQGMQLTANIALVQTRRLLNIDVASLRTCYAKVRAYGSDAFNIWDQVSYILVDAVFREATDSRWRNFGSSLTLPNSGACLRVFCDVADSNAFTATFTASLNAEKSLDAASSINQDSAIIGVSDEILPLINYRRSGHGGSHQDTTSFTINLPQTSNVTHLDGPFYRDQFDCLTAPVTHDHFRFSMKPSALFEFNTIPIDENNIFFTWQNTPLIWWPRPNQFRSCYMKVKIIGTANAVVVESRNTVGSRQDVLHQLYGIREDSSVSNGVESTACIEFKCSGVSLDQQTDQTVVDITPRGSCSRTNVNVLLTNYLTERNSLADQVSIASFKMFAPTDPLGHNYGIYTVTTSDPITSKQLSKGRCMAGQSSITSSVMQVDNNVAVTFNCGSH